MQDFELGGKTGWQQDDSSVRNVCMPTRGPGDMPPPRKILNLYTSQIAIWDKFPNILMTYTCVQ